MNPEDLPRPAHVRGYTPDQINSIFYTPSSRGAFADWMRGQTVGLSDEGECIVYPWDVERYLLSLRTGRPAVFD